MHKDQEMVSPLCRFLLKSDIFFGHPLLMEPKLFLAVTTALCLCVSIAIGSATATPVLLGNEVLRASNYQVLLGHRVAVLSNPTGVFQDSLTHIVDDMVQDVRLNIVCILSPEHGFRGEKQAEHGDPDEYIDAKTGLTVYSAYRFNVSRIIDGVLRKNNVTAILVDFQDVGTRLYTFIWTMHKVMEAAVLIGTSPSPLVIVLDRPNPLGGAQVDGPLLDLGCCSSGYGMEAIPHVHGMTIGELSLLFKARILARLQDALDPKIETNPPTLRLQVIACIGWDRSMVWTDTNLLWVPPSPNLPTPSSAFAYPATVFIEALTGATEGRGTCTPFLVFGSPFIDPWIFTERLNREICNYPSSTATSVRSSSLPCFRAEYFEPTFFKFNNTVVNGTQFFPERQSSFAFFSTATHILVALKELSIPSSSFVWDGSWFGHPGPVLIDWYAGTPQFREMLMRGQSADEIIDYFAADATSFLEGRKPYLLY